MPLLLLVAGESPSAGSISLPRFEPDDVLEYLNLILGENDDNPKMAELLHAYSGGLPLLVAEGLKFLAPHFIEGTPIENILPPPEIGSLYKDRIHQLAGEERTLLETLAVIFRAASCSNN